MNICQISPDKLSKVQPLFREVFGHEIGLEFLRWKYADGAGQSWACVDDDDHVFLHCGLFFRDILIEGKRIRAAQLVDLMGSPKTSGLSSDKSPFSVLLSTVLLSLKEQTPEALAFGFPSGRAMRLAEHLRLVRSVDEWLELVFPATPSSRTTPLPTQISAISPPIERRINRFWDEMARDLAEFPLGVRDSAYISRRYFNHPENRYHCLFVNSRWLRRPIGFAALKNTSYGFELLDVVCALAQIPKVLSALQCWLGKQENKEIELRWHITSRFAKMFAPLASDCCATEFRVMANPNTPDTTLSKFDHTWWLTGGDSDYR